MHLVSTMAINTDHVSINQVDICRQTSMSAQVFVSDSAVVTGSTGFNHRWSAQETVTVKQASTNIRRSGNVAISAGRMASRAGIRIHFVQSRMIFRRAARIQGGLEPS